MTVNHSRIKELNINPERIQELIKEVEKQEIDVEKEMRKWATHRTDIETEKSTMARMVNHARVCDGKWVKDMVIFIQHLIGQKSHVNAVWLWGNNNAIR